MTAKDAYLKLLNALDSRMPDTELLQGDGDPVEDLVKKRMRILNATAQAMLEEHSGPELARHEPRQPDSSAAKTLTHCACGLKYEGKLPEAHQKHLDKVLVSILTTIRDGVLKSRQINWMDVKEEADQWHGSTESRPN